LKHRIDADGYLTNPFNCEAPIAHIHAIVRRRTTKTKGYLSRKSAVAMTFKLMMSAKQKWRNWMEQTECLKSPKGLDSGTG
jgi:DNA-binding response OmpR family regulator